MLGDTVEKLLQICIRHRQMFGQILDKFGARAGRDSWPKRLKEVFLYSLRPVWQAWRAKFLCQTFSLRVPFDNLTGLIKLSTRWTFTYKKSKVEDRVYKLFLVLNKILIYTTSSFVKFTGCTLKTVFYFYGILI